MIGQAVNPSRRPSPLGQLLSGPGALAPPRPDSSTVAPLANLPSMLRYGTLHPQQQTATPFSGAQVTNPITNLVHPPAPPTYSPPSPGGVAPGGATAPALAALGLLAGAPHGGPGTGPTTSPPTGPPTSAPTGATVAAPSQPTLTTGIGPGGRPVPPVLQSGVMAGLANEGQKYQPYGPQTPLASLIARLYNSGGQQPDLTPLGPSLASGTRGRLLI